MNDHDGLPDPPRREPPSLIAATAIVLSLCALGVSVLEVSSIRSEQRVGVWPYIDLSAGYNSDGFSVTATNKGIGPARVRSMQMTLDGEPVTSLDQMILDVVGPELAFSYDVYRANNPTNSVLSPDEEAVLFGVPWTPATRALTEQISRFSATLCYCSVYDECWLAVLNEGDPEPVSQCPG
ncbi:MAG: hypothetical protein AAF610_04350 [Pseudomonadota bacterium]